MRGGWGWATDKMFENGWWGPPPAEAPTLVLLHEGLGSVSLWRDFPDRLAEATGWGVFAYSRFGYGYSDPAPLPWPMTYMHHEADPVLPAVLESTGIKRTVLIGHSDGGSIAAIYAGSTGAQDKRVAGLVTIAAHFFVEDLNITSIRKIKDEYDNGDLRARLARYHREVDIAFRGWNDAWLDPRFRDFDITALLPNIRVPILALQGDSDPYGSDEQIRVFEDKAQAPFAAKLIAGGRHSPHLEAKEATLAAVADFIAKLPRDIAP